MGTALRTLAVSKLRFIFLSCLCLGLLMGGCTFQRGCYEPQKIKGWYRDENQGDFTLQPQKGKSGWQVAMWGLQKGTIYIRLSGPKGSNFFPLEKEVAVVFPDKTTSHHPIDQFLSSAQPIDVGDHESFIVMFPSFKIPGDTVPELAVPVKWNKSRIVVVYTFD